MSKPTEIPYIAPVKGAASYRAYDCDVYMTDTDGYESHIQQCRSAETAIKAAMRWQRLENRAVLKSKGII